VAGGFKKLFMSHPPLAERIQALREYTPRRLPTVA
jgi:Zn-dependent protease with chaperone function